MKNYLKNAILAIAMALPIYAGTSITYDKYRQFPEIVERKIIDNHQVTFVRTKSKNPILRVLDNMFRHPNMGSTGFAGANGNIRIDISKIEEKANEISKEWNSYEQNSKISKNDPGWDFSKQIVYNVLNGSKDIRKEYFNRTLETCLVHEFKHADDIKRLNDPLLSRIESETKAHMEELKFSPLAFSELKEISDKCDNGNSTTKSLLSDYCHASNKIFKFFGGDYRAIGEMSPEKIKGIAETYPKDY